MSQMSLFMQYRRYRRDIDDYVHTLPRNSAERKLIEVNAAHLIRKIEGYVSKRNRYLLNYVTDEIYQLKNLIVR